MAKPRKGLRSLNNHSFLATYMRMLVQRRTLQRATRTHQNSEQARKAGNDTLANELRREGNKLMRKTFVLGRANARILKNKPHFTSNQRKIFEDGERLYRALSKEMRKKQHQQ